MNKSEMIEKLESEITSAINSGNDSYYAKSTIANSRGVLSGLKNPPRGVNYSITDQEFKRIIWNLQNVTRGNKI